MRAARTSSELREKEFLSNLREKRFAATKGNIKRHNGKADLIWYYYVINKVTLLDFRRDDLISVELRVGSKMVRVSFTP